MSVQLLSSTLTTFFTAEINTARFVRNEAPSEGASSSFKIVTLISQIDLSVNITSYPPHLFLHDVLRYTNFFRIVSAK